MLLFYAFLQTYNLSLKIPCQISASYLNSYFAFIKGNTCKSHGDLAKIPTPTILTGLFISH